MIDRITNSELANWTAPDEFELTPPADNMLPLSVQLERPLNLTSSNNLRSDRTAPDASAGETPDPLAFLNGFTEDLVIGLPETPEREPSADVSHDMQGSEPSLEPTGALDDTFVASLSQMDPHEPFAGAPDLVVSTMAMGEEDAPNGTGVTATLVIGEEDTQFLGYSGTSWDMIG